MNEQMTWDKWKALPEREREQQRDLSGLSPQLLGLEGWRVEVTDEDGDKHRFIVSRSTGWRPCHIELKRINSSGGFAAASHYASVRRIRKER